MAKLTESKTFKFEPFHIHAFNVLENVYKIEPSRFVRLAIEEKLKRDIPKLRLWKTEMNNRTPFDKYPVKPVIL